MNDRNNDTLFKIVMGVLIFLALCVGASLVYAALDYFVGDPPPTQPKTEDSWERIQDSGKMIVGTSADYPPFAYYADDYQLDGMDIALIHEIARRLGVEIEIKDMAFEGLDEALLLEQIDVAIAAISVTPQRETAVDFSQPYFISEDAVLANRNSPISQITRVEELAPYRIGVQRATVYERWITEALIDTNLMPANNLFVYGQTAQAVDDLANGRLDIVVMDLPPAGVAVTVKNVKLVGQGLNRQLFAIAMGNGQTDLQNEINAVLLQLQGEGFVSRLVEQYMGLNPDEIVPVPTLNPEAPTLTPQPTATAVSCVHGMKFVEDLSYDDNDMTNPPVLRPGQAFSKGWQIRNTGNCNWDNSFELVYIGGNSPEAQMGGQPTAVQGIVQPNRTVDMYVALVAPIVPGTYQGFWTMRDGAGNLFGDRIWVGITVPAPATATPLPTQTPSPGIHFVVDRTQINAGECVVFSWNVSNVQAVYFYQQGQDWQSNQVPFQGSRTECPPTDSIYELRVLRLDGSVETRQITIYVNTSTDAPIIERFTVDPTTIQVNQCVDLRWEATGEISRVILLRNGAAIWDGAPHSGSTQDCPPGTGQMEYRIEASGPGGVSELRRMVTVVQPTTIPPTATPYPTSQPTPLPTAAPPVIYDFSVMPGQIEEGDCVTVVWNTGGGTDFVRILRNGAVVLDNGSLSGTGPDCLDEQGNYTYRLEAHAAQGRQVSEERQVVVTAGQTDLPLTGTAWRLKEYWDGVNGMAPVLAGNAVTAVFDANGALSGSGGCNSFTANYTLTLPNDLNVTDLAATSILCDPAIMEQENAYFSLLPATRRYSINGVELELIEITAGNTERVILRYEAAIPSPR